MTQAEIKVFYAEQVEWYKKQVAWNNQEIEWLTGQIERERAKVRDLKEYVWSKGVLTRTEMQIWGDDHYESREVRNLKNQRRRQYRERKKYEARVAEYEKKLEEA